MSLVPDIKLLRADTTLDLSQKADKGIPSISHSQPFLYLMLAPCTTRPYETNLSFHTSRPPHQESQSLCKESPHPDHTSMEASTGEAATP
jgi:hypothetical protein